MGSQLAFIAENVERKVIPGTIVPTIKTILELGPVMKLLVRGPIK
jgi:hypothetical protein